MRRGCWLRGAVLWLSSAVAVSAEPVTFKAQCLKDLVSEVPGILASQNQANGHFGKGIWLVTDQDVLLPLAVAWGYDDAANSFRHQADVLEAIVRGGDALIAAQDKDGRWLFEKKDGSTWGQIYMPWTYSRWIRTYQIVREALSPETRANWDRALTLGFTGIAREVSGTKTLANIPTHHAMSLYFASQVFHRADWAKIAHDFMQRVVADQNPDGYWSEHSGPVINYGFVYLDAIGLYAAASHDPAMVEPLRRASLFHAHFTYPDGTSVETVDERNPYGGSVSRGSVGITLTPEGRAYFAHQLAHARAGRMPADTAASLLLLGEEGEPADSAETAHDFDYRLPSGDAAVRQRGSWFLVASGFTAPLTTRRWIQDRQNLVSVYHRRVGLILGGGNTKLQPRWSNFTAGDIDRFAHRAGDENPKFIAPAGVVHVATHAAVLEADDLGLTLDYAGRHAEIRLHVIDDDNLDVVVAGDRALAAHLTFLPRLGTPLRTPSQHAELRRDTFRWEEAAGSWLEQGKVRVTMPVASEVRWPVLPHNPYRKDGRADKAEGRIVVSAPMDGAPHAFRITISP